MSIDTLDDIEPPYREGEGDAFARQHAKPFDPADPQAMRELVKAHGHLTRDEAYALCDALEEARASWDEAVAVAHIYDERNVALRAQLEAAKVARDAENDRVREFWQAWAAKRLKISRTYWLRAAKLALKGDMRDLRLRVQLAEAPPVAITLSEDAVLEGKPAP